ncbi:MAG TPA: class I SAM-dependent methyltransferase [Anaerolineales bacterium]
MTEDVRCCPLCGSERSRLFDRREFRGQVVTNRVCRSCGLVCQSPRMTEEETVAYYRAEYRRMYQGVEGPIARDLAVQTARAQSLIGFARPHIAFIGRCLDIGCSTGLILQHFKDHYDCQPVGIEPGDAYRAYAQGQGLTVYPSLDELEKAGEKRFSLICMSHVLEHLPNPVGYLNYLRESILTLEGWLLIEVPNLYAHDSFEVAHLYAFSPHALHEVLRKSGFEVVKFEKHGRPNSALLPLFLTVLCRPALKPDLSPVRQERGVALKRRIGMFRRRILARLFPQRAWLLQG